MKKQFLKTSLLIISCFACLGVYANHHEKEYKFETLAEGLSFPWGVAFLSNDEILVTEKTGKLRVIKNGNLLEDSVSGVPDSLFKGQGGLEGIVLHPNFENNKYLYLAFSETDPGNSKLNTLRVIRGKLEGLSLTNVETIFKASPSRRTANHYGAKMVFLKDGTLLITSGDGFSYREMAQELDNHYGKVIRVNDDGSIPEDNPFISIPGAKPEIWSYGHRNLQGIVINSDGSVVYEHEHGPRGGDELNIIEKGKNYGWPAITYGIDYSGALISPFKEKEGMEQPIKYWVPSIAPSGMTFYDGDLFPDWKGSLFISALVPGDVRRISLNGTEVIDEEILFNSLGRIRNVVSAPDGAIDGTQYFIGCSIPSFSLKGEISAPL
jgi:glucose/arabinose dehydrogenase